MFMCIAQFCASQDVWRVVNDRQLEYLVPPWEWILQTNKPYRTLLQYDDVIMGAMASQITSLTIVYSTVYSGADQSQHQSSASLAFVWGIHWGPVNSPHKWPVTRKCFHLMTSSWQYEDNLYWYRIPITIIKCLDISFETYLWITWFRASFCKCAQPMRDGVTM